MSDAGERLSAVLAERDGRPHVAQLRKHVPPAVMAGVLGVTRRSGSSWSSHPYVAVIYQDKNVSRFLEEDWLSPACIAEVCLRAP